MEVCVRAVDLLVNGVEDPAPVYLLKGTDGYIRREVVRALQETVPPEARDMCLEEYGDDDDIYTVVANLSTVSMFGGKKVVYLRRQKDLNDREKKLLKEYVSDPADTAILLIDDKGQNYIGIAGKCVIVDCGTVTEAEAKAYVGSLIRDAGASAGDAALSKLYSYCGGDLGRIVGEAQKLTAYAEVGHEITANDVEQLVAADVEYKMFEMTSAFTDGKAELALAILSNFREKGESPVKLLYWITSAYRKIFHIAISELNDEEEARALDMSVRAVAFNRRMIEQQKKRIGGYVVRLKELVGYLYELEYKFKSGAITDESALNMAVAKILTVYVR